jgi:hypothetical protein
MTSTGASIGQFEISRDGRDHGRPRDPARTHSHTTFRISGHRAPQISLRFFACLSGQSAVTSSDHSNNLGSSP